MSILLAIFELELGENSNKENCWQVASELSSLFALEEKNQLKKGTFPVCHVYLYYLSELS